MKLGLALKPVSYMARLQILEKDEYGTYHYLFPEDELITRHVLEYHYKDLLDRELSDGFHGEGIRDGLYIHIKKEGK
jgi:hypothetical protein